VLHIQQDSGFSWRFVVQKLAKSRVQGISDCFSNAFLCGSKIIANALFTRLCISQTGFAFIVFSKEFS